MGDNSNNRLKKAGLKTSVKEEAAASVMFGLGDSYNITVCNCSGSDSFPTRYFDINS
ncbi:MAG: hypothetical protein QMD71_01845 [bacterium]|nr:hypothetical protein [bacterium]